MKREKSLVKENKIVYICDKVIEYGIYFLVFFVPLIVFQFMDDGYHLSKIIFLRFISSVTIFAWGFKILLKKKFNFNIIPLGVPILAFMLANFISSINSVSRWTSLNGNYREYQGLYSLLTYVFIYFLIVSNIRIEKQLKHIITLSIISAMIISIYGILQEFGIADDPSYGRIYSTLGNPIYVGTFLSLVFPLSLFLFLSQENFKPFVGVTIIILYTCLLLSYSRTAYISFLISIFFFLIFINKKIIFNNRKSLLIIFTVLITITVILSLTKKIPIEGEPISVAERSVSIKTLSTIERLKAWKIALKICRDYKFIGSGVDTFNLISLKYREPTEYIKFNLKDDTPYKAHNEFLEIAANSGLLGFFTYLLIFIVFFKKAYNLYRFNTTNIYIQLLIVSISSSIVAYLIQSMFIFNTVANVSYFWILLGTGLSLEKLGREDKYEINQKIEQNPKNFKNYIIIFLIMLMCSLFLFYSSVCLGLANIYYAKGNFYANNENYEKAISEFEKVVSLDSKNKFYWLALGSAFYYNGYRNPLKIKECLENAILSYKNVLTIDSYDINSYSSLGWIYLNDGEYLGEKNTIDKALFYYKKAVALSPNQAIFRYNLGMCFYLQKRYKEAITQFRKVQQLNPEGSDADLKIKEISKLLNEIKK